MRGVGQGFRRVIGGDPINPAAASGYSYAAGPTTWPAAADLLSDHYADRGITFRDTLYDASATGDAITLTGTLGPYAVTPHDIRVDITTAGAPGTGKFRVSINSGHDYIIDSVTNLYDMTIPVGLTYAIPGTLITLNFANVAFNLNAIYVAQIEQWDDQSGNGHSFTRESSNIGPLLIKKGRTNNGFSRLCRGVIGQWALTADAAAVMQNTGTWANAGGGGTNNSFRIFVVAACDLPGAVAQNFVAMGRAASATPFIDFGETGSSSWRHNWRNDAGTTGNAAGGTSDARVYVFEYAYDGTNSETRVDGTIVATNAVARGAVTLDRGGFFARVANVLSSKAKASIRRITCYKSDIPNDRAAIFTLLKTGMNVTTPKTVRICYEGDSYYDQTRGNVAPPNVAQHGNDNVTVVNGAVTGSTIADMEARTAAIDANYSAGAAANILFIHVMMNDANGAGTAAAIEAAMRSYIADRQTVGWYVIIDTLRDRSDAVAGYAAKRATLNTSIRADHMGANDHIDSDLNAPGSLADNLYYADDGVGHPTSPEASREADLIDGKYDAKVAT